MLGVFSAIFYKGDNFHGFLFAFLHTTSLLLKKGLHLKERISKFFPFRVDPPFSEGRKKVKRVASLESISINLKNLVPIHDDLSHSLGKGSLCKKRIPNQCTHPSRSGQSVVDVVYSTDLPYLSKNLKQSILLLFHLSKMLLYV